MADFPPSEKATPQGQDELDLTDDEKAAILLPTLSFQYPPPASLSSVGADTTVDGSCSLSARTGASVAELSQIGSLSQLPVKPSVDRVHQPVSVSKLFTPGALPLIISHLDEYFEALPLVTFTPVPLGRGQRSQSRFKPSKAEHEAEKRRQEGMFAPLERLEGGAGVHKYLWNRVGKKRVRFAWARPSVMVDLIASLAVGIEVRSQSRGSPFVASDPA